MKNRQNREFWTALGSALVGLEPAEPAVPLTAGMDLLLQNPPPLSEDFFIMRGQGLQDKRGRHIYTVTWNILRDKGFSRPFRYQHNSGIEILMPFRAGNVVVLPQGFQPRVPAVPRALAVVGRSALLREAGYHMVVCSAVFREKAWLLMEQGHCSVCTPDRLTELLTALDFSR